MSINAFYWLRHFPFSCTQLTRRSNNIALGSTKYFKLNIGNNLLLHILYLFRTEEEGYFTSGNWYKYKRADKNPFTLCFFNSFNL